MFKNRNQQYNLSTIKTSTNTMHEAKSHLQTSTTKKTVISEPIPVQQWATAQIKAKSL